MFRKFLFALALLGVSLVQAQTAFPDRPVKIVVPLAPGGGNDIIARIVAQRLAANWKQPVIVENKAGGQTTIGANFVAKSDPDGYTLLSAQPNILASSAVLLDQVPYDWETELTPVAYIGSAPPFVLAVSAKLNIKTVQELRSYAQAKGVTYGSAGTGGPFHVYGEWFVHVLGVKGVHVPYKAAPPAVLDVVSGNLDMIFAPPAQIMQHVKAGTLIPIAVVGDRRVPSLPDTPTMVGLGLKQFPNIHTNYAIFAPAKTPPAILKVLREDVAQAYEQSFDELVQRGLVDPHAPVPKNFVQQAISDGKTWAKLTEKVK
jgi:tripartite-type tricarboxylate transporter receptor subunit TctC